LITISISGEEKFNLAIHKILIWIEDMHI